MAINIIKFNLAFICIQNGSKITIRAVMSSLLQIYNVHVIKFQRGFLNIYSTLFRGVKCSCVTKIEGTRVKQSENSSGKNTLYFFVEILVTCWASWGSFLTLWPCLVPSSGEGWKPGTPLTHLLITLASLKPSTSLFPWSSIIFVLR